MENLRTNLISTALGIASSAAGLFPLPKCSGNSCTSCFGCAGSGIGILLLVLFSKMKKDKKEENYGMAQRGS